VRSDGCGKIYAPAEFTKKRDVFSPVTPSWKAPLRSCISWPRFSFGPRRAFGLNRQPRCDPHPLT
jgi:hypothetical protein